MWAQALLTSPAGWVQNKILQINKQTKKIILNQNSSDDQVVRVQTQKHHITLNNSSPFVHSNPFFT